MHRAFGAEVVVDDVEDDRDPAPVRGVDEFLEPDRSAVALLDGEGEDAVVSPVARPGECGDREGFDGVHPERDELPERRRRGREGAGAATPGDRRIDRSPEGPNVELIEDEVSQRRRFEQVVAPRERSGIEQC